MPCLNLNMERGRRWRVRGRESLALGRSHPHSLTPPERQQSEGAEQRVMLFSCRGAVNFNNFWGVERLMHGQGLLILPQPVPNPFRTLLAISSLLQAPAAPQVFYHSPALCSGSQTEPAQLPPQKCILPSVLAVPVTTCGQWRLGATWEKKP